MSEKHCRGRGTWKGPLQEMNFSPLPFTRQWEDESRVASRCFRNTGVYRIWDYGAKRLRIGCMTETPNIFNLLGGKLERLGNVDV